ncbi:MAG: hypothetical protein KAG61_07850 [Bacteriovoracaceae bacterium]|nr:hypothetical protein [Bacteriovoracaceae bacterium]
MKQIFYFLFAIILLSSSPGAMTMGHCITFTGESCSGSAYGGSGYSPFKGSGGAGILEGPSLPRRPIITKLYDPEDHPLVIAQKKKLAQTIEKARVAREKALKAAEEALSISSFPKVKIAKKYYIKYSKNGFLSEEETQYLIDQEVIWGVVPARELSPFYNDDDGLNSYRDLVYGEDSTLGQRKITQSELFHKHAFREGRWASMMRMKKGEALSVFKSVEHFKATELLSRASIYYANQFLNKENPTDEDMIIGHSLLDDAKSIGDFAMGAAVGVKGSVVEIVNGVPTLVKKTYKAIVNYEETIDQFHELIETFDSKKFGNAIKNIFVNKWDSFVSGSAYDRGEIIGSLLTEIGTLYIPGATISLVAKATKYTRVGGLVASKTRLGRSMTALVRNAKDTNGRALFGQVQSVQATLKMKFIKSIDITSSARKLGLKLKTELRILPT